MLVYLIPSIMTIGTYHYFEKKGAFDRKRGVAFFVLLFSFLILMAMFRVNIGVDYGGYLVQYERIKQGLPTHTEIGFITLVKMIVKTYDNPRIMFAVFSLFTLMNMLLAIYKQSAERTLSLFLFISMGYYNLTYNSIRYYYALSLVFLAYAFLEENKKVKFVLIILFAALFHKTALIVIPTAIFFKKNVKRQYFLLIVFAAFTLIFREQIRSIAFQLYPSYVDTVYDGGSASLFNVLKGVMVLIVGMIYKQYIYDDDRLGFLYRMNIFAFILYVCCSWIPELSRIGYYFNITSVVFLPNLLHQIKHNADKMLIKYSIVMAFSIYLFLMLAQSYSPRIHLLPYETWLF